MGEYNFGVFSGQQLFIVIKKNFEKRIFIFLIVKISI